MTQQPVTFDPLNPTCPQCGAALSEATQVGTTRYDAPKLTLYVHFCACGKFTGFVVADNQQPGEPYTMQEIPAEPARKPKRKWRRF